MSVLCFADSDVVSSNNIKCFFKYEFANLQKFGTQKCFKNFADLQGSFIWLNMFL